MLPAIPSRQTLHHYKREQEEIERRGGGCEMCDYCGPRRHFNWAHMDAVRRSLRDDDKHDLNNKELSARLSDSDWHIIVHLTRYLCLFCHSRETEVQRRARWKRGVCLTEDFDENEFNRYYYGERVARMSKQTRHHYERTQAEFARRNHTCEENGCNYSGPAYDFNMAHIVPVRGGKDHPARKALSERATDEQWLAARKDWRLLCLFCHADKTLHQRPLWQKKSDGPQKRKSALERMPCDAKASDYHWFTKFDEHGQMHISVRKKHKTKAEPEDPPEPVEIDDLE